jgi:hypothetical protein
MHEGVAPRDITFSSKPTAEAKGDKALKALEGFRHVRDSTAPLVDPEVLAICHEMVAEDAEEVRLKDVAALIDEGSAPVDLYKTFRILSSQLGRVFFKAAKGSAAKFKARAQKEVDAAKQTLCSQAGDEYGDFCLV